MAALTKEEISILATYNSEVSRGLLHTPRWVTHMQWLQERFDAEATAKAEAEGIIIVQP